MVNVFIIDDHPAISDAMGFLMSEPETRVKAVGSACSMKDALEKLPGIEAQVVLLDLHLGMECPCTNITLLRKEWPSLSIIIFSADDTEYWKQKMFQLGANAYLDKTVSNEAIIETILRVANGTVVLSPDCKYILDPAVYKAEADSLTLDELSIATEIAHGLSLKEIASKLHKSSSLIEKNLRIVRTKTGARSNPDLTRILLSRRLIPYLKSDTSGNS